MSRRSKGSKEMTSHENEVREFVTMGIAGQTFGIPVLQVQDVLGPQRITRIPLAPPTVAGTLNLRGRIVTAINARARLGLAHENPNGDQMSIVVEHRGDLYSIMVDEVGEVLAIPVNQIAPNPPTLDKVWRDISMGVHQLKDELVVVVDIDRLLDFTELAAA